jgi:VWFA-related protein
MCQRALSARNVCVRLLLCVLTIWSTGAGQVPQNPRPQTGDDVVRVFTDLVQTDVMVFDKQGRFVKGLARENFELRIDGKVKPIQSFEQIAAGSNEETQLAAARGSVGVTPTRPVPLDRGRTVFFYVDDFHLDLAGLTASRKVISNFIEREMGQNDQTAISCATGQIGFLQQLTDNRTVLNAALNRLSPRSYSVRDSDRPPMSEYEAMLIDRHDSDVLEFFVDETLRLNPGLSRDFATEMVRGRAEAIESQAAVFTNNTLIGLERLARSAKAVPGRKVVFLLSDGFFVENSKSDAMGRLRQVTSAAARSGVVIYSLDTRGLVADLNTASSDRAFDPSGRLDRATHGELSATQDGLNALAVDTGGRAIFNTNDLSQGIGPALAETSVYYLLAWKPDNQGQKPGRFRKIEVRVADRPELTVRVRRGFFDVDPSPPAAAKTTSDSSKTVATKMKESILAAYPQGDLPITLGLDYYDVLGQGSTLSTSVQVPGEFLVFGPQDGKIQAVVDLTGVFFNDRGMAAGTFVERLVTTAPSLEASRDFRRNLTYTYPAKLAAGLYQVRVAARDAKSGRIGSAHEWIEIPDLSKNKLTTSSLLIGERPESTLTNVSDAIDIPVSLSVSHRFKREANLRLLIFTYNAAVSPTEQKPDLAVQVQLLRDDQPVITTSLRKIKTEGVPDLTRIPYAAEVPLSDLSPGRYVLQVSVIDRVAKQSFSQHTHFDIY